MQHKHTIPIKKYSINTISENPFSPSGAQGYYYHTIKEMGPLLDDNEELYIFCSRANYSVFEPLFNGRISPVIYRFSNEKQKFRVLTEHVVFPKKISELSIDVYNSGNIAPFYIPKNCKIVATLKTMHAFTNPESMSAFKRNYRVVFGKHTAKNATLIISNSHSNTDDIITYLPVKKEKIRLVYEALNHDIFNPLHDGEANTDFLLKYGIKKPFILFVSSLYQYKNVETLLHAYRNMPQYSQFHLVIVGFPKDKDYQKFLLQVVEKLQIEKDVIFTGGVSHDDTAKFYQSAEVFVSPSYYETFGLTLLEAMASGCPVITSNVSSMPEIADNAALLFHPSNIDELKNCIERLISSKGQRQDLVQKGLRRAKQFTWRNTAQDTLAVFREALEIKETRD